MPDELDALVIEILRRTQSTVANLREKLKAESDTRLWEGLHGVFAEMKQVQDAVQGPDLSVLGTRLLSFLPSPLPVSLARESDLPKQLLTRIVAVSIYPDVCGMPVTPQHIAAAIRELAAGCITIRVVTFIRGVVPADPLPVGKTAILLPSNLVKLSPFRLRISHDARVNHVFSHSVLFCDARFRAGQCSDDDMRIAPGYDILQAMRLASTERLRYCGSVAQSGLFDPSIYQGAPWSVTPVFRSWPGSEGRGAEGAIIFTPQHVEETQHLLPFVENGHHRLSIPIGRFDLSMRRPDQRERLVDLVIAAESLLASDYQDGNLSYKLRMRGVYGLRSIAVHQGKSAREEKALGVEVESLGEDVRNLIRHCVRIVGSGREDFEHLLDHALLGVPEAARIIDSSRPSHPLVQSVTEHDLFFMRYPPVPGLSGAQAVPPKGSDN